MFEECWSQSCLKTDVLALALSVWYISKFRYVETNLLQVQVDVILVNQSWINTMLTIEIRNNQIGNNWYDMHN